MARVNKKELPLGSRSQQIQGGTAMKEIFIADVLSEMQQTMDNGQLLRLKSVLEHCLHHYSITDDISEEDEPNYTALFLAAKRIEGRSEKSLAYYKSTIDKLLLSVDKSVRHITTDDLREFMAKYQEKNSSSKVTIDNIRRILSTFSGGWRMKIILLRALCEGYTRLRQAKQ